MSTTARRYWLKTLRLAGVRHIRATSGLGLPYICQIGDFAGEAPFYKRSHSVVEIAAMAAWCGNIEQPIVYDIGANNGFVATQLAQLIRDRKPHIYAFEPVPSTFAQLVAGVRQLGLNESVTPVCLALSDSSGFCRIAYNPLESLFAQVRDDDLNQRAGTQLAVAVTATVDKVTAFLAHKPHLLKVDVEGFEGRVLRGATALLGEAGRPAICFEWNPLTLSETGNSLSDLEQSLSSYNLYYLDDFEGQRMPFGEQIHRLQDVHHVCNVFAVPNEADAEARWNVVNRSKLSGRFR